MPIREHVRCGGTGRVAPDARCWCAFRTFEQTKGLKSASTPFHWSQEIPHGELTDAVLRMRSGLHLFQRHVLLLKCYIGAYVTGIIETIDVEARPGKGAEALGDRFPGWLERLDAVFTGLDLRHYCDWLGSRIDPFEPLKEA